MRKNQQHAATVYDKALSLLAIRMHTVSELHNKLLLRGFEAEEIDITLKRLINEGYLNDESVAEAYLDSLIRYKTFGYYGLKAKLLQKGLASSLIERLLTEKLSVEDEKKIAQKMLEKTKHRGDKAAAALKRKGFRTQVIFSLLDDINIDV